MLAAALRAEAASFVAQFEDERLPDGRHRIVRHGTGPERMIQTGIGPIPVQRQKVRDRASGVPAEKRIRFSSNILPRWARRSKSLDALLPVLYLRGISTGDFQEALTALLGTDAPNLSPGAISRLTAGWQENYDRWQRRDLSARRYVYVWADGVYLQARDAAGRDGDARTGARSLRASSRLGEGFWFAQPGSCRSFAHTVQVFLTTPSRTRHGAAPRGREPAEAALQRYFSST